MLLHTEADTKKVTRQGIERIADWLRGELPLRARDEFIAAGVKLLGALLVAAILHVFLFFLLGRLFFRVAGSLGSDLIAAFLPALPLVIGLVIQAFIYRKEHGFLMVHEERVHFRDQMSFIDANSDNGFGDWWRILLFPAWLFFSCFESLVVAYRLRRAPTGMCAEVLAGLAAADRRVYLPDMEMHFGKGLAEALRALVSFPGVLVASRDTPSFLLSQELGEELREKL